MRKNTEATLQDWHHNRANNRYESIWTDGTRIYSYQTILVEPTGHADRVRVNVTKYSPTTSQHQNGILAGLGGLVAETVDGIPMGAKTLR